MRADGLLHEYYIGREKLRAAANLVCFGKSSRWKGWVFFLFVQFRLICHGVRAHSHHTAKGTHVQRKRWRPVCFLFAPFLSVRREGSFCRCCFPNIIPNAMIYLFFFSSHETYISQHMYLSCRHRQRSVLGSVGRKCQWDGIGKLLFLHLHLCMIMEMRNGRHTWNGPIVAWSESGWLEVARREEENIRSMDSWVTVSPLGIIVIRSDRRQSSILSTPHLALASCWCENMCRVKSM